MHLYKVCQRLGAVPPDPRILDLQPVKTPFKKSWVRPCTPILIRLIVESCQDLSRGYCAVLTKL